MDFFLKPPMEDGRKQELEHYLEQNHAREEAAKNARKTLKHTHKPPISHVFLDPALPLGWNPSTPPHTQCSTHHSRPHSTQRHPHAFRTLFHIGTIPGKRTTSRSHWAQKIAPAPTPRSADASATINSRKEPPTLNQSAYEPGRAPTNPTTHTTPHYSTDRTKIASSDQCTYPTRHSTRSPPP